MDSNSNHIDKIDAFLKGEMSSKEKADFSVAIEQDKALKLQLEKESAIREVVIRGNRKQLKEELAQFESKEKYKGNLKKGGLLGIVAVTIFSLSWFVINFDSKNEAEISPVIHTENFETAEAIVSDKTASSHEGESAETVKPKNKETSKQVKPSNPSMEGDPEENLAPEIIKKESINTEEMKSDVEKEAEFIDVCSSAMITGNFSTVASCKDEASGSVKVFESSIQGGERPYSYALNNKNYISDGEFENLRAGEYVIWVKDVNGCSMALGLAEIEEKNCMKTASHFSIEPSAGVYWNIPVENDFEGKIIIANARQEELVTLKLNAGEDNVWKGKKQNGGMLEEGNYTYKIFDGSQNLKQSGTIRIR